MSNFKCQISKKRHWKFDIGIYLILVLFLLIGILQSKNPQAGFYGLVKLLEFGFFGWYTSRAIKNKKDFGLLVLIFSLTVCFESVLGVAQYINQSSIGGIFYFLGERTFTSVTPGIANTVLDGKLVLRPYATFPHPNVLAGYLTIALAIVISNLKSQISNLKKFMYSLAVIFGTIALFLTMSRVAIFIWIIVVIFNLKSLILNHKSFIVLLVCIGSIILTSPFFSRFFNTSMNDESVVKRIELISTALAMVKDHPIFGVGLNNFLPNLPYYQKNNFDSLFLSIQPVHNVFFLIVSEAGIVGLLFFMAFIKNTINHLRKKKKFSILNFQFSILAIVFILGLFDHYFFTLQQGQLLLAFVLGICWLKQTSNV